MRIFSIFKNDMRRLRKDMSLFITLLAIPLAMILPAILTYEVEDEDSGLRGTPLVVANYDGGEIAADYVQELDENLLVEMNFSGEQVSQYNLQADPRCAQVSPACDEAVGRARLDDGSREAMLIIPAGLNSAFKDGKPTVARLIFDPGGDSLLITQIEKISQGLAIKVALTKQIEGAKGDFTDLSSISQPEVREEIENMLNHPVSDGDRQTAIHVDDVSPAGYVAKQEIGLVAAATPQFAVLFIFLFVMQMTAWSREEQFNGLFRRLLSTPAGRFDLIAGKLVFGVVVCLAQMIILFGAGILAGYARGLPSSLNVPAFLLLTLALSATSTSLGLLFSATRLPASLALAPMLIGGALGGSFLAIDFMPPWLAPVSYLMPQRYGILGYQDLMARGGGVAAILPETGVLLLFTLLFVGIAVWRFDLVE
jgi:ABC-2 type transport system permease protein